MVIKPCLKPYGAGLTAALDIKPGNCRGGCGGGENEPSPPRPPPSARRGMAGDGLGAVDAIPQLAPDDAGK